MCRGDRLGCSSWTGEQPLRLALKRDLPIWADARPIDGKAATGRLSYFVQQAIKATILDQGPAFRRNKAESSFRIDGKNIRIADSNSML